MRRLVLASLLLSATGCYDFAALGNHHDAGVSLPSTDLAPDDRCTQASDCADGNNCNAGHCVFAADSCAAHKAAVADAPNGVYWINDVDGGAPEREFCDMMPTPAQAICSPRKLTRKGFARDGSQLTLSFTSVFTDATAASCQIWGVEAGNIPLGIVPEDLGLPLNQCQVLGFADDDARFGGCKYGSVAGYSNCGFASATFHAYGHNLNGAITPQYTYGGPYTTGTSLTTTATTTPSVSATCKTGFVLQLPLDDR